jgi:allantoin racemase
VRIWYQSFLDRQGNSVYVQLLQDYLDSIASSDVEYEVIDMYPPDRDLHWISEWRCGSQVIRNALRAKEEGVDCFAIGHFQDVALTESRASVDIPVYGLGECSMLHALTLGERFGLITINPIFIPWHERQVIQYGLHQRYVGVRAMETTADLYMRATTDDTALEEVIELIRREAEPLVEAGAEVVVPAGGLPGMMLNRYKQQGKELDLGGAVMLNCVDVLAKYAEMAVRLRDAGTAGASRRFTYRLPSERAREDFLASLAQ